MGADLNSIVKVQNLSDEHVQFLVYQLLRGLKVSFVPTHFWKVKAHSVFILKLKITDKLLAFYIEIRSFFQVDHFPDAKLYIKISDSSNRNIAFRHQSFCV